MSHDYYSMLAGVSGHFLDRLQSVLNACSRPPCVLRTLSLGSLRSFTTSITGCECVPTYRCLSSMAPSYLAGCICQSTDADGHSRLRSSTTLTLTVFCASDVLYVGWPSILCRQSSCVGQSAYRCTCCNISHEPSVVNSTPSSTIWASSSIDTFRVTICKVLLQRFAIVSL